MNKIFQELSATDRYMQYITFLSNQSKTPHIIKPFVKRIRSATLQASGIAVYSTYEGQLEIAGFETNRFLVFVVSDLDHDGNLKVASDLVPPVYEFLHRLEA